jgi:hypothetical protein
MSMTPENTTRSWRDMADQLTPKQVQWLTHFETHGRTGCELVDVARKLASTRWERDDITAAVAAALEGSGIEKDSRANHLWLADTMIGVMGLHGLTTTELVALNAILAPAHGRFLRKARREGRKRRSEATR